MWLSRISELFENVTQFQKDFDPILNGRRSFLLKREVSEQSPSSIARAASSLLNGINVSLIVIGGSTKDLICPLDWVANNYSIPHSTWLHGVHKFNLIAILCWFNCFVQIMILKCSATSMIKTISVSWFV